MRWGVLAVVTVLWLVGCTGDGDGPTGATLDAAPQTNENPACMSLDSRGGFPDCSVCDAIGAAAIRST